MNTPFETWYAESGHRHRHFTKSPDSVKNLMQIAFENGLLTGLNLAKFHQTGATVTPVQETTEVITQT